MEAIPKFFTVKELCEGFVYSESEQKGLFGAYSGRYPFTNSGDIRSVRW